MDSHSPITIDPTGRDIHEEARRIRAQGPVARIMLPGGVLAWSITSYEHARQALADPRFSKDPNQHWTAFIDGDIGTDFPLIGWVLMDNITTTYGDDHNRLRRLTAHAFTPRRVAAMRSSIEKIAIELLDDLETTGPGDVVDLKARFAHQLPAQVICDLFGIPEESRAQILRGGETNVDTTISHEQSAANVEAWQQDIRSFIEAKRTTPGDDVTTDLILAQEEDGARLTDSEILGTLHLLLATGTEPVMNLITNVIWVLLTHPAQRELLRTGQTSWKDVIEETLRAEAPVGHLPFRFAVEDIEIGGVTIARGDPVLINFAAVGRDPAVHGPDADQFDATRPDKQHLSFGHAIYRCIGAPLAWAEVEIGLPLLFERFPRMALGVAPGELRPEVSFIMNGRLTLPVRLTALDHEVVSP